jgi:hypothetical protein
MKMAHFIPYSKSITGKKKTKLFLDHVFCYHGLLEDIVLIVDFNFHPNSGSNSLNY